MSTYAIGDVQGCRASLEALLEAVAFDPERDRAWFVGDLVNRGPDSLGVLRLVHGLGDAATVVLGNHDLHLLARARHVAAAKERDTLAPVLEAPDADELLEWLASRPFVHREGDVLMVHAGLHPSWTPELAERLAADASAALRSPQGTALLRSSRKSAGRTWRDGLTGLHRDATAVAYFSRLRTCAADGRPLWSYKGPPEAAPAGFAPWFEHPYRRSRSVTVVFGHWAALGLRLEPGVIALDTGCVWGKSLTAVRLEDRVVFQVPHAG